MTWFIPRQHATASCAWIDVAVQLGLADLLDDGPQSVEDLAAATGTHAPSLARPVRALAALRLVAEADDGRIELTPLGVPLRADVPGLAAA